jgi:hypothetical protein
MKSLIRWSATLGVLGSAVLGSWLSFGLAALALPPAQILEKLQPVPVFAIADQQGAPLVATGKDNKKVAGVFISQQDAQNFVQQLQKENPDLGKKVKVVPVSLGEVYQLAQANEKKPDGLNFAYVPTQTEVESAKKLLTDSGKQYSGGVPLFVAKGEKGGYLTVLQNNQQVIPFFFEKVQLQQMVDRFIKEKPDIASTLKVEVVPLESVINTLQQSNEEMLTKIVLVPSEESIKFLRSQSPGSLKPQNSAQPQTPANASPK